MKIMMTIGILAFSQMVQASFVVCPKTWPEMQALLQVQKEKAQHMAQGGTLDTLQSKIEKDEALMQLTLLMWPEFLEEKHPFAGLYRVCADIHSEISEAFHEDKSLIPEKIKAWETCLRSSFRDEQPKVGQELLTCYKSLNRK